LIDLENPWVEKYRPTSFKDIISQSIAINNLKSFVDKGEMPHMIFTGPAGTGKTSTALIIARAVIKREDFYSNILELNASDSVRMDYVRNVIKEFVNQRMMGRDNSLKFILLDEADNIPTQVQQALRRIIEKASSNVKFILMCNYINKIIDPIVSRCAVFRFTKLSQEKVIERLKFIAEKENLKLPKEKSKEFFKTLFFISGGDLRKAINALQMAVALDLLDNLDIDEIYRISGFVEEKRMKALFNAIKRKKLSEAFTILNKIDNLDARNFIRQVLSECQDLNLNEGNFMKIYEIAGDVDYRISQGSDEQVQIFSLISSLIEIINLK